MNVRQYCLVMVAFAGFTLSFIGTVEAQRYVYPQGYQAIPAQPGVQYGTPGRVYQQPQPIKYYDITLTKEQKAVSSTGASFGNGNGGVRVESVFTNSPAQKAGVNSGDIITEANGKAVSNSAALSSMIKGTKAGESIKLTKRNSIGEEKEVTVTLMTLGQIIDASTVPEANAYDNAALRAEQSVTKIKQEIKNAELDLEDLKKRLAAEQKRLQDLRAKAKSEREKEKELKAKK